MILRRDGDDLLMCCKVQARARHDMFGEARGDEVIIKLHAPAVDGKANAALLQFIAAAFALAPSRVRIERGQRSRHKVLRIVGVQTIPTALRWLGPAPSA